MPASSKQRRVVLAIAPIVGLVLWQFLRPKDDAIKTIETYSPVYVVGFSPTEDCLAVGQVATVPGSVTVGSSVYVFDTRRWERMATANGPRDGIKVLAYSRSGHHLATGGFDGIVRIWDAENAYRLLSTLDYSGDREYTWESNWITALEFDPIGNRLAVAIRDVGTSTASVRVVDWDVGEQCCAFDVERSVQLSFSADGNRIAVRSTDWGPARVFNVQDGTELATLDVGKLGGAFVRFSPDGKYLVASDGFDEQSLAILDATTYEKLGSFDGHADTGAFDNGGNLLCVASQSSQSWGEVRVYDMASRRLLLTKHPRLVFDSLSIDRSGKLLAIGGYTSGARGGRILIYSLAIDEGD